MNTLENSAVAPVLRRLHAAAASDATRWAQRRADQDAGRLPADEGLVRMGELYLAVSPSEGRLLRIWISLGSRQRLLTQQQAALLRVMERTCGRCTQTTPL